jgi:hypothetical protein
MKEKQHCFFCGESTGRDFWVRAPKPVDGQRRMICDACVAFCGRLNAEHRFAFAIKVGTTNVTRFVRRARRPVPTLEVVA